MTETRKLAAILAADVVGYSRLTATDEERTIARLRGLHTDLIDPAISVHHGRVVKRTGDGILIEFRSVVDAIRCAIEVQSGMVERNAGLPPEREILFRVGIHLGDVIEETDGDLMGDGVNIAARLEGICEPGKILLSRAAKEQIENKIGEPILELGRRDLKNIARPIEVFAIDPGLHRKAARGPGRQQANELPRLSIVVLPFANLSGDAEQEYFVDGLTEDLTTELSRIPGAFVIARNTAFTYKGKAVDAKEIGKDLGVRYVLEGSIRRSGSRVRVNAQLIDAETGAHVWADRFDREIVDLFELQDALTFDLAGVLGAKMVEIEGRKSQRAADPTVVDLVMQARAATARGVSRENYDIALALYERALVRDPNDVMVVGGLAKLYATKVTNLISDNRPRDIEQAIALANKALSIDPSHLDGHFALGMVFRGTARLDEAKRHQETVIRLNPNSRSGHSELGWVKQSLGDFEGSLLHFEKAIQLSPRDLGVAVDLLGIGVVHSRRGETERAIEYYRKSYDLYPQWVWSRLLLASAYARTGRMDEAKRFLGLYLSGNPAAKPISELRRQVTSKDAEYLRGLEPMYDGLREAGMPEE